MKTLLKIALFALLSCQFAFAETDAEKIIRLEKELETRLATPDDELNLRVRVEIVKSDYKNLYKEFDASLRDDDKSKVAMLNFLIALCDGKGYEAEAIMKDFLGLTPKKQEICPEGEELKQTSAQSTSESTEALESFTLALPDGTEMEFKPIPAGTFMMGSPEDEEGRGDDENQVRVNITKAFYMGKTEVTEAQYSAVIDDDAPSNNGKNEPVTHVGWDDAVSFCKHLTAWAHSQGKMLGWKFTLPTEAQWEYACRAGTTTKYHSGDKLRDLKRVACYTDTSGWGTDPVGQKEPNAWGLYDMHGNVWEWCSDWYADSLRGGNDPVGALSGSDRVFRGGGWFSLAQGCRSASRDSSVPENDSGFSPSIRVAVVRTSNPETSE